MRRATKLLSALIVVVMLMQMIPVVASAMTISNLGWHDSFYGAPMFNASAEGMIIITLYKDGKEVDSTWYYVSDWEVSDCCVYGFYSYKMVDLGAGAYHYTVTTVDDATGNYIDTFTSSTLVYNPPKEVLPKLNVTYDGSSLKWNVNGEEYYFAVVEYLTYGDGVYYDLILSEVEMNNYKVDSADRQIFEETAQLWYEDDPVLYPISKARLVAAVYAVPYDRTIKEMSKSDYIDITKGVVPPSGGGSSSGGQVPGGGGHLYWDDTNFGEICYSNYKGSTFHKIVLDNGENTYSQTRSVGEEETDLTLTMSSSIAKMGSGTYTPTITYYVSRADQTVLHTVTGPSLTYVEPTQTFNPLPTVKAGNGYVQFANYDDVYCFSQWMYVKYSHTGEEVIVTGQDVPIFLLEDHGRFYMDDYNMASYNSKVDELYAKDPVKYNKDNAQMYLTYEAMANDIRVYKSYDMGGVVLTFGNTADDGTRVDRSSVSEEYYDGAKAMFDLGIVQDVYDSPKDNVTKDEFAYALTAFLGGKETAATLRDTAYYTDLEVGTELNGCANYLKNMGILYGNQDGTFGADTEMLYEVIIKALVDSLGYQVMTQNYGGYPTGYLYVASRYQIAKGVNLSTGSTVTTEQLAQLLYNALEVGMMEQTGWGTTSQYAVTNKTALYNYLGYTKALGTLSVNGDKATIDGRAFDATDLTGRLQKYTNLTIADNDIYDLVGKGVKLYVKDNNVYSGFEYYGGEVIINDGATETDNPTVNVKVIGYSYTKYKVGDGEYKPLPADAFDYTFDAKDGKKTLSVTFATDDESKVTTVSSSIQVNNKRTITYMVNGQVYDTKEVGVGSKINPITNPNIVGYTFNGWKGFPTDMIMPDKDLVITADVSKLTKVTGVLMYNGAPLTWAKIRDVRSGFMYEVGQPDSTGAFTVYLEPGERMLQIDATYASATYSTPLTVGTKDIDLGTIVLDNTSTYAIINDASVKSVAIPDEVISAEDEAYVKQSSNNSVYVTVSVSYGGYIKEFDTVVEEQYPQYEHSTRTLSVEVSKQKRGAESTRETLEETNALVGIKVEIPEDLQHKSDFLVLRKHDDEVQVLTTTPNADGEYVKIDGRYATIYAKKFSAYTFAGTGLRFNKVADESFEIEDKAVVEVTLGSVSGTKVITVDGQPLFYSAQRKAYVALIDAAKIGTGNAAKDYQVADGTPEEFVYGNVDGDEDYEEIEEAVDGSDLQTMKLVLKGKKALGGKWLIASDLDGDGLSDGSDLQSMKLYIKNGKIFAILK